MNTKELLDKIFEERTVTDKNGNTYALQANIDRDESNFLIKILRELRPAKTIEIGCAYGLSTLSICSEIQNTKNYKHTIVDPFQSTQWKSIGITNLERCGIDNFELIEQPSEIGLPNILQSGEKFDFALIDGWHTFDHTLIDFFYLNKMLNIGGIIVIDDVAYPSVRKVLRYILNYPSYELVGNLEYETTGIKNAIKELIKMPFKLLAKLTPHFLRYDLFSPEIIESSKKIGLQSSMIAIKKIKEDDRNWLWYEEF